MSNPRGNHQHRWHHRWEKELSAQKIDDLLEEIWLRREENTNSIRDLLQLTKEKEVDRALRIMAEMGLISIEDEKVTFRPKGERRAQQIIRRHRLAECLLYNVFDISKRQMETSACHFEHILSVEVTDSICTFLGHPPFCPHDRPIPPGSCCAKFQTEIKPLIKPLTDLGIGEKGQIVFINPRHHDHFDRLSAFGIVPGSEVLLHQREPSYVIKCGETELAMEETLAKEIYVKHLSS